MSKGKRVILAIGAHHDDAELGCGGTLARLSREGHDVHVYVATTSGYADPSGKMVRGDDAAAHEAEQAARILGVTLHADAFRTLALQFGDALNTKVRATIEAIRPDTIFTHFGGDVHNDHWALAHATLHASRHVPRVAMYRSNWYSGTESFRANLHFDISDTLEVKLEAIRAHKSEWERTGKVWTEYFANQARNDGITIGTRYAESFQCVRWLAEL
jgi:LmbE family N-acetylglucosaminyl deacetylase